VQELNQNDNHARDLRSRLAVIRHRIPARLAGRGRYVALGAAALAVAGLAALGVSTTDSTDPKAAGAVAEQGLAGRQEDAGRADRSTRTSAAPSPTKAPQAPAPKKKVTKAPAPKKTTAKPAKPVKPAAPAPKKTATKAPAWVTPMAGAPVTSCYGTRWGAMHQGIDYALPPGTPVRSIGAGKVVAAGWAFSGYGISVVVDHGNGYQSHYAHLSSTKVSVGQRVATGQTVGLEGSTGDSTGPHLHFEIHNGLWNQVDPAGWLRARGVSPGGC